MSLKICYLMPRMLPTPSGDVIGGGAANCVSLALELKRQGADVELLTSVSPEGMDRLADKPVAEILRPLSSRGMGLIGKGLGAVHALRRGLKARLRETRFDIVHAHSGTYPYAIAPLLADRLSSVRLHSLYCPLKAKGGVYSSWWENAVVARFAFDRLDRVIAVTGNVRRSLERAGVQPGKIELLPMCVDTERFRPRGRNGHPRYFCADTSAVRLLYVGNASREKGLMELLYAVKMLLDEQVPVSLVAAIENQCGIREYAHGHRLATAFIRQAKLQDRVRLTGLVDSIEDLYAESDLVVIPWHTSRGPSDYPMVVLEAMATGKCVISTPVGGCPELLAHGRAGILASGFSPRDIAAAIEFAVRNPVHREAVAQQVLERVQDFSLANSAKRLLGLYERLMESKGRHRAGCST